MIAGDRHCRKSRTAAIASAAIWILVAGCVTAPQIEMRAERYRLEVRLDPSSHRLTGRAVLDMKHVGYVPLPKDGPVSIAFRMHPQLKVSNVYAGGARVVGRPSRISRANDGNPPGLAAHVVRLAEAVDAFTLFVEYEGPVHQDVQAGEIRGSIHNFDMAAHIGLDGIYLADGGWYPTPIASEVPKSTLADFSLVVEPVPGFELVAAGQRDKVLSRQSGRLAWSTPYPVDGMVLVGGPHEVHHTNHNGVAISAHLKPSQAQFADGLLQAVRNNLDRYEPLIGPYPTREYTIVDNFFSSGFAFPSFTLLSSAVIEMGDRSWTTHGYLDHEMLHSWWGNGVAVDPADGNWCESLTSYAANYYGHVLDGNDEEARRKRRNYSHFLSRIEANRDKPLGTYEQPDGCGRGIAYQKGAAVFHMLARKMGQEKFWSAMRRFTSEYTGRYAGWKDIQRLCEDECGDSLETFFQEWVRGAGAPTLTIEDARYDSAEHSLSLSLSQSADGLQRTPFHLNVPVRVLHAAGSLDLTFPLEAATGEFHTKLDVIPLSVAVDPDYHVFRKVAPDQIIPTTASTRYGSAFTCVLPGGALPESFARLRDVFESSFGEDERITLTADELQEDALAERCVLILGDAVRHPYVSAFLTAVDFPVRWPEGGFELSGVRYADVNDAVLCTVRHPGVAGGGITVLYANSEAAIPKADNIPFYEHSLVIFDRGRPTVRLDFEHHEVRKLEAPD